MSTAARRPPFRLVLRWLWTSDRLGARLARAALVPVSVLWRGATLLRDAALARGWLPTVEWPAPVVAVGNLTLGSSGTAPVSAWIAAELTASGCPAALLLATEEGSRAHQAAREARSGPSRYRIGAGLARGAAAAKAVSKGTRVLVVDNVSPQEAPGAHCHLMVVSAESSRAAMWPPPAGPWREGLGALASADAIIVTRKRADERAAREFAAILQARSGRPVVQALLEGDLLVWEAGEASLREVLATTLPGLLPTPTPTSFGPERP